MDAQGGLTIIPVDNYFHMLSEHLSVHPFVCLSIPTFQNQLKITVGRLPCGSLMTPALFCLIIKNVTDGRTATIYRSIEGGPYGSKKNSPCINFIPPILLLSCPSGSLITLLLFCLILNSVKEAVRGIMDGYVDQKVTPTLSSFFPPLLLLVWPCGSWMTPFM